METPKLLWLKRNNRSTWNRATKFFDLADYLVYRATGTDVRSECTTTCKWTYLVHEKSGENSPMGRWDDSYFREIGLCDLVKEGYKRIGQQVKSVGEPVGGGLTELAAEQMGLKADTPVSISIIDAHAGGLGLLGMNSGESKGGTFSLNDRIALIGGTSSCHMAVSEEPRFINGVWGPYYSAMVPGLWLTEGGQSATGALVDHVIYSSRQSVELEQQAEAVDKTVYQLLNERLHRLVEQKNVSDVSLLTKDLHVLPYFHGNRSPRANPSLRGSICGLQLSSTLDDLALLYLATIQAIAYGTRHIIEELNNHGFSIDKIMATGGGTKNELFVKEHANITGCQVFLPKETEAVLLGSAVLGAVASGEYPTILDAIKEMNKTGEIVSPVAKELQAYHQAKYQVFHQMYQDERSYSDIMEEPI
jgi:FGGY-family pentulose kinase